MNSCPELLAYEYITPCKPKDILYWIEKIRPCKIEFHVAFYDILNIFQHYISFDFNIEHDKKCDSEYSNKSGILRLNFFKDEYSASQNESYNDVLAFIEDALNVTIEEFTCGHFKYLDYIHVASI